MDMSFANQALAAEYVARHHAELEPRVYAVPEAIDREVARLKLDALGIELEPLTEEQVAYMSSWQSRHLSDGASTCSRNDDPARRPPGIVVAGPRATLLGRPSRAPSRSP